MKHFIDIQCFEYVTPETIIVTLLNGDRKTYGLDYFPTWGDRGGRSVLYGQRDTDMYIFQMPKEDADHPYVKFVPNAKGGYFLGNGVVVRSDDDGNVSFRNYAEEELVSLDHYQVGQLIKVLQGTCPLTGGDGL